MNYLLDTCVISEAVRKKPEPGVMAWLAAQDEDHLFMSVLTLGELHKGIARLDDPARQSTLEAWVAGVAGAPGVPAFLVRNGDRWTLAPAYAAELAVLLNGGRIDVGAMAGGEKRAETALRTKLGAFKAALKKNHRRPNG